MKDEQEKPYEPPSDYLWGMYYGNAGVMHSDGNAGKFSQGLSGFMAGFDRMNDRKIRGGLFLSIGDGSLYGELQDRTLSKELMVGHYVRKDTDNIYMTMHAGLGNHNYKTKRKLSFGYYDPSSDETYRVDRTARGKYNAFLATAHFEAGLKYRGGIFNLSPFMATQYTGLVREGFTERGADSLNLTTDMNNYHSMRTMFGVRFDSSPFRFRHGMATFYGNVAWMYEFEPNGKRYTQFSARFSDVGLLSGTPKFTIYGNDPGRDWVQTGFGFNYDRTENLRLFIGYDAYANPNQVMHTGNIGFTFQR
jgi:outer membrane autotransporter protein